MQLKTLEASVDVVMHTPIKDNFVYDTLNAEQKTFFVKEIRSALTEAITQDRADIRAVLKNEIELLRQAEWVADGESNYLEACNDLERVVDTLLPGDVSK